MKKTLLFLATAYLLPLFAFSQTNCASKSNAPWNEWITNVQLNTLNNTTGKIREDRYVVGYSDWKDKSTMLTKGQSYPLSITPGLSYTGYQTPLFFRGWIDYNANGIYEANELVLEKNSTSAAVNQSVVIPTAAINGSTTMRVSMKKDAYPTACETFAAGEVEDYTVIIQDGGTGSCTPSVPTRLYAKDITATTAKLVWSKVNNAIEYEYQFLYDDTSQPNGGALISSAIVTDTFANLALVGGRLRALVRSRCVANGTWSAWSLATHFNAQNEPCTQGARTAFVENFESGSYSSPQGFNLPICWNKLTYHAPSVIEAWTDVRITSRGTVGNTSKRVIMFRSEPMADSALMMLVSPEISNLSAGTNRLRFKAANTFGSSANGNAIIQIGTLSNPFDGSSFTSLGQYAIGGNVFSEYIADFSQYRGTDRYFAFKYISSGGDFYRSLEIDDVAWEVIPNNPCLTDVTPPVLTNCPSNISLTTTGTTAVANWTAPTATDNCSTPSVSSTYNSGFAFPIGTTTIIYTATDAKNNKTTCSFQVTVSAATNSTNDLAVTVATNTPTFTKWTTTGFKVQVKNLGSQAFTNIEVTFPYPTGTVNGGTPTPSVGTFQQYCSGGTACYKWTIPSLAANATATLDVPLFALDVPMITGTATLLTSTPTDTNAANNTASATMTLQQAAFQGSISQKATQLIPIVIQNISPNPSDGELRIRLESLDAREVTFTFYNALGKVVKTEVKVVEKGQNRLDFNIYEFEQGLYFVTPSTHQGHKVPTKFVKL